jgi:hypothetical protein
MVDADDEQGVVVLRVHAHHDLDESHVRSR